MSERDPITVAMSWDEAAEVGTILETVLSQPQVWREADGWHLDRISLVANRIGLAVELAAGDQP